MKIIVFNAGFVGPSNTSLVEDLLLSRIFSNLKELKYISDVLASNPIVKGLDTEVENEYARLFLVAIDSEC